MSDRQLLVDQLIRHEGLRLAPYMDAVGKITIGVGRNLSDCGISDGEALTLLDHDVDACIADLVSFPWFVTLDPVRQRALVNMRFNLGAAGFRGFQRLLRAVAEAKYDTAADAMRRSLWARQVPIRAAELITMMQTGKDVDHAPLDPHP